ncbi:MAG: efflux RND transporter permease subunit [Rikenellaceae bacterium]
MDLKQFIVRPVLSSVISIIIVVMGLISLVNLPVEQYPDIAPPTIQVTTTYYGASAETILNSVIAPLEESINGVEDMTYMTSKATNSGSATISVYFNQGTNSDMAAVNVQNRVTKAMGSLPAEVTSVGVTTAKRQNSMLQVLAIHSPNNTYDQNFLSNYLNINLQPQILRVNGVGEVNVLGSSYSMRIWMKPDIMAQYKLNPSDITAVLAEQNIEAATGSFGENSGETFQYSMKYTGRLMTEEEFNEIVIRSLDDGEVLRLKDVARVEFGADSYAFNSQLNSHNNSMCIIYQTAGSNATEINLKIDALIEQARKDLPKDVEITQILSSNDFLFASIHEVIKTLFEAILLVTIVVYIFLQDFRSTIIPIVGIFVSLIGTFAFMMVIGFSLNLITLFALILVIGTVVDDSIVVVEAVQARFEAGYLSSYQASIDAMKGLSSAIFSTSLVFMVVFIPVSFMGGTSGTFYKQFGLTMAVAVGISMINALTLSPALCALLLKPHLNEEGEARVNFSARFRMAFNTVMDVVVKRYSAVVMTFIKHKWLPWATLLASVAVLVVLMNNTKTGLVPDEDQGILMVNINAAPGSSLDTTSEIIARISERIEAIPEVRDVSSVAGYGLISGQGSSYGLMFVKLLDWEEREGEGQDVNSVINKIYMLTSDIKDAQIFAMSPGMIPGYGVGNALEMYTQDKKGVETTEFYMNTMQYLGALNQRPEIAMAYSSFNVNFPQWEVDVDAAKCKRAGVSPSTVLSTISAYYGSQYVSNINRFSKVYRVMIQADPEYRVDEKTLDNTFVRMNNGEMAPISQFVTMKRVYGADALSRFNLYSSIQISAMTAPGYSTGDAIKAVNEVAETNLPQGVGIDFGGITREESGTSGGSSTAIIFGICFLMIYLILSGLYESYILPLAVILSIPFGLMGSFVFAQIFGLDNNIYLQTGLIMLIGLLSKTAILITEYASARRLAGMSIVAAAVSAAKARFRAILMTALSMVFGLLPLMMSSGVGANGNRSLASGTVGGMVIGTLALMFITPAFFIFFQWLQEKFTPNPTTMNNDLMIDEIEKNSFTEEEKKALKELE